MIYDIMAYGAVCDGTTDDTAAIQAAIDAAAAVGGGTVFIPRSTACSSAWVSSDNIVIDGGNAGEVTVLNLNTNHALGTFIFGKTSAGVETAVTDCAIRNLTLDGDKDNALIAKDGCGVCSVLVVDFTCENVHVHDFRSYGFAIIGTGHTPREGLYVRQCSAARCGQDGLDIKGGFMRVAIDGFHTHDHHLYGTGDDETTEAMGLDIRGQYVSIRNVFAHDNPQVGIRVRGVTGEEYNGDTGWTITQNGRVTLENCFCWANNDGFHLEGSIMGTLTATGIHAHRNLRYGAEVSGEGTVNIFGSTFNLNDTPGGTPGVGIWFEGDDSPTPVEGKPLAVPAVLNLVGCTLSQNTQDGIRITQTSGNPKRAYLSGCSLLQNTRNGVYITQGSGSTNQNARASVEMSGCLFDGNASNINTDPYTTGLANDTNITVLGGINRNASTRGVRIEGSGTGTILFQDHDMAGNTTPLSGAPSQTRFQNCSGLNSSFYGEQSFNLTITTNQSLTFPHGLYQTPPLDKIALAIQRVTSVSDYAIQYVRVASASTTNIIVEIKLSTASATVGATGKVSCLANLGLLL